MKKIFFILFSCLVFTSCGKEKDVDKIGDAQICLDELSKTPAPAEVNDCLSKVDSISSAAADGIRCAGGFIKEGFSNSQKYIDAFASINSGTSSSNNLAFMSILTFQSSAHATNVTNSVNTFNYCYNSGAKGSTLLAAFSYLTMSLFDFVYNLPAVTDQAPCGGTSYNISTCLTNNVADIGTAGITDAASANAATVTLQNGIGTVLIATYNLSCKGSAANKDLCTLFETSITAAGGTSSPRTVAVKFFQAALGIP